MSYTIKGEIARFEKLGAEGFPGHQTKQLMDHGFLVSPESPASGSADKPISLTLMGITHGNEWAGIGIVNGVLSLLKSGLLSLPAPVAFILGNVKAAVENRRFLERDLNRSFDRDSTETWEDRRARDIEKVLDQSQFLVDFHQTLLSCEKPFFIFPYSKPSFDFARRVNPSQRIVTHWGDSFSKDGRCTDEYLNTRGGVGISLETGQNGFDPAQISVGIEAAIWAIAAASNRDRDVNRVDASGEIFTWAQIVDWPGEGTVTLKPGLINFMPIGAGEVLGQVDGKDFSAEVGGRIIFPKYLTPDEQAALKKKPAELCRLMKCISENDLPG
jgi:hypothetical protein